ncbi:MAG: glycosyltransferase family 4 protein [Magnetococcales bacterium]|nr:glycosyltransferase family 4 protein [Magnetococcales bacterium]
MSLPGQTIQSEPTGNKPKLLILAHLPPPVHGVTVMSQYVVNSSLLHQHFEIFVLPIQFAANLHELGKGNFKKLFRLVQFTAKLIFHSLTFRPDLIYFTFVPTGMPFYRDAILLALIKVMGFHTVLHLHGIGIKESSRRWFNRFLYRRAFSGVQVIHLSPLLYYDIEHYVNKEKCHFLANGIPTEDLSPNHFSQREMRQGPVQFLFLSNIMVEKGPLDFIQALGILKNHGRSFRAVVAGAVASQECLNQLFSLIKEYHLEEMVRYVGPKYGAEKEELLMSSDIFVFPTHRESFPLVLLEAMSHALPAIAPVEGSIPAMIDDGVTGILFPKRDIEKLAHAMELLEKDKNLRNLMGQAGRDRFLNHFTLKRFETDLARILVTCCQR